MLDFAPHSRTRLTYDEAVLYCFFLDYKGHRDWRLPTEYEYSVYLTGSFCWDTSDANYTDALNGVVNRITVPVRTI